MAKARARIGWLGVVVLASALLGIAVIGLERGRSRSAERSAFPQTDGELRVAGLEAPLELLRDARGVPHVRAGSERDAWFGLGFAHAQDRLAQMLWLVRLARGSTAEVIGPRGLEADRHARTLGLGRLADAEAEALRGELRELLAAYSAGVNARMQAVRSGEVGAPVAVRELALPLDTWTPGDSLAILKLHAWGLSNSVAASLVLHDLLAALGGIDARPFFPEAPGALPPEIAPLTAGLFRDPLRRALGLDGASAGSTAWVVSGAHTATGRALLGADIHVAPTAPALLHVAHVSGGKLDVVGAMIPGLPLVWSGRSAHVAWGATHARAVVTDLYTERVNDEEARYHDGGRWRKLEVREESIPVRGAAPEQISVRATRHGPLLDMLPPGREPLALAWVGFRGKGAGTLAAFRAAALAADAAGFRAALAGVSEPALAVVFADAKGAGGVQVAGWIPERPLATELVPVPGRARWFDWGGPIPFSALPAASLGGERKFLVAADNAQPTRGPVRGEWLWRPGVRATRLERQIEAALKQGPLTLDDAERLQADVGAPRSLALWHSARVLVEPAALGREASEVFELLAGWDGHVGADSAGAAAYHAFELALLRRVFEERMGREIYARWLGLAQADRVGVARGVVMRAAQGGGDIWSDPERVRAAVAGALRDAWFQLSSRLGASRRKWSWGRLQQLDFASFVPMQRPLGLPALEAGGSGESVATLETGSDGAFEVRLASLFRLAAEPGADALRFQLAPGESEHPGHAAFADGLDGWAAGLGSVLETQPARVAAAATLRLALVPGP